MTEGRLDVGGNEKSADLYEDDGLTERIDEINLVDITSRSAIHRVLAESGFAARKEWRRFQAISGRRFVADSGDSQEEHIA